VLITAAVAIIGVSATAAAMAAAMTGDDLLPTVTDFSDAG
jgi:hypothetical protein